MTAQAPVAIITGGSAGIGWEIGQRLAADGYLVIAADRVPGLTAGENPAGILWLISVPSISSSTTPGMSK